jgi:hypothetical protein
VAEFLLLFFLIRRIPGIPDSGIDLKPKNSSGGEHHHS